MFSVSYYLTLAGLIAGCFGDSSEKSKELFRPVYPQCKENEVYKWCGTACPKTCNNYDSSVTCNQQCTAGCFCKDGFVRNYQQLCVTISECKKYTCVGANELYSTCGTGCPLTCANKDNNPGCPTVCSTGCFCRTGFVRDDEGICIRPEDCPEKHCNGKREEYITCGPSCPKSCDDPGSHSGCTGDCVPGCFCKEKHIRNHDGVCVLPDQCKFKKCNENEEFKKCGIACEKNCDNYYKTVDCILKCVPGCFCISGYVRNDNGVCIPISKCEPKCGNNEVFNACGTKCPKTCKNKDDDTTDCPSGCQIGCFCKDEFVRNEETTECIRPKKCPKPKCGHDEVYKKCGTKCPKTCRNKDETITCDSGCKAGCFCKDGYVRNENDGKCITPKKCPASSSAKCGRHEIYKSCGTNCPKTCENKDKETICDDLCKEGCFCKDGYVRNENKVCILPNDCPKRDST